MINKIVENCIRDNIVQESEVEVIRYGLENLISNALGFIMLATLGAYFGNIVEGIILWISIYVLRKNAGGFHAETKWMCFWVSFLISLLSFLIFYKINWSKESEVIISTFFVGVIYFCAPIENFNKRLNNIDVWYTKSVLE